jgi:nucleotide-binding universal stress UspA family protein
MTVGSFKKIMVAVDGSEQSMAAADKAIQMARENDADLIAVNVLQLPVVSHYTPAVLNSAIEKGITESEAWFDSVKRRAEKSGVSLKTRMIRSFGSPSSEIVSLAEKENVDLIVTGTKGRGRLRKILLGSTASGIVMNAGCTVMVVR